MGKTCGKLYVFFIKCTLNLLSKLVGGPACIILLTFFKSAPIPNATDEIMSRI